MAALDLFRPPTRAWFEASFLRPTAAQEGGWKAIAGGGHTLIHAPTGSGKTLAAFLWAIDRLHAEPTPARDRRCRVLYVSPMKALAYDVDRNLRAPLVGIRHAADRLGVGAIPELTTFLRSGDTAPEDRRRMQRMPPDILITTPESLYLMLTSAVREVLATVRWVIVDEIHSVAATKRGAHLTLSLERLEEVTEKSPQRIGLSATQRPLERIASFLGGSTAAGADQRPRPVTIVDAPSDRPLELQLIVPVEDMAEPGPPDPLDPDQVSTRSLWPAIYPRILEMVEAHRSTIIFANSRRLAERICAEVNLAAGAEIARAHHGSVAREQRIGIEEALKNGELKAVVSTSSLELGIDMGAVDLVIQVEAPPTVASGLQRVGRAGHHVGGTSLAAMFPKYRGDLLVSTVMAHAMGNGSIEETAIPRNPLDVLAQQIVAECVTGERDVDEVYDMVRRAHPYTELSRPVFDETIDMLTGRFPSDLFSELRPRLNFDRHRGALSARAGARQLAVTNAGTIPDRGLYRVTLPDGVKVGELDEEMVYESRPGDCFLLGSSTWRITAITPDRVEVVPAPGEPAPRMPFWRGDMQGRPLETGLAVGKFTGEIGRLDRDQAVARLKDEYHMDDHAAANLWAYLEEEKETTGFLPTDQTLVAQTFRDEIGDWRLVLLSPLGAKVHAPWALALRHRMRARYGTDIDVIWSDDGIALRFPDADEPPGASDLVLDPDEVEPLLLEHLADTSLFAARFREAAGRSLLLPRRRPGQRTPLWMQRRKAADLLGVARQFGSFPIVLEVYREILQDDFDLDALKTVLSAIGERKMRLVDVEVASPSPFATSLLYAFVAAYLYESDTPIAERRAAALTLDRGLLAELLGEGELRDLLDPEVVAVVELELQRLTADRQATTVDAVHDLLRDLGPLTLEELKARASAVEVDQAVATLVGSHRVIEITWRGEVRMAAIEDASRLRDALGVQPPPGVPDAHLQPVDDPLGDVVARYARTHGPFAVEVAASALSLPQAVVVTQLQRLQAAGRVVEGAFRPGGAGREWVDERVLKRLKRRSLAVLRQEIEPVPGAALGRFLPKWQGVTSSPGRGTAEVLDRLAGFAVPASTLERDILAARLENAGGELDGALLGGSLVWVGLGALGPRDGRVALYPRERFADLRTEPREVTDHPHTEALLKLLEERGASFFADLYPEVGGDPSELIESLWDLVWAGLVTNDTMAPLRAYLQGTGKVRRRPALSSTFPASAGGRWSLVAEISRRTTTATERSAAWAQVLLDRQGIVTRPGVLAESVIGGFAGIYPVLSHLEETGRARRGYFVEGLGGAQFAPPGAVDRLRSVTSTGVVALAAADPANPYGAALPWPELDSSAGRHAGAYVFLAEGELVGYLERGRKRLTILGDGSDAYPELARAIADIASRHRRTALETIGESSAHESPLAPMLSQWGFAPSPRGLRYRGSRIGPR